MPLTSGSVLTAVTMTTVDVSIGDASGGTLPYTYKLQQAPDVAGAAGTYVDVGGFQSATRWTVTGLTQNTPYWFRVVSQDGVPATVTSTAVTATTANKPAAKKWFPRLGR